MSGSFRWILSGGRDQIQLRNPIDSWLPAPLSLSRAAMFLERTLEPGRATAESVKRFNVRFSWPKSFLFFFWGRWWVFWFQKMLRILMFQLSLTFFSPNQNMWGEMRMKILTQKVFRLFHTPSHIQASWETWMGNTEKYWRVFTVVQSPLHQVTVIFVRHHITPVSCQPFILLCLPCFRCSTSSGCFGRRRFWKILDTKITHRPRRWHHHSFSDGGEFFWAASWRVLFCGSIDDRWYVICIKPGGKTRGSRRFNGTVRMIEKLRVLDARKVRLLPN